MRKRADQPRRRLPNWARTPEFLRVVRYAVTGGLTTAVNFGLTALLHNALHWEETPANTVAVVCAVVFAYLISKWFVFRTRCRGRRELFREILSFFSGRAATMVLEIGGVYLLADLAGMPLFWIKGALTVLVILLNYVFSQRFVFRRGEETRSTGRF